MTASSPADTQPAVRLSAKEKAAVIARVLLNDGPQPTMSALGMDNIEKLTRTMAGLTYVDQKTVLRWCRIFWTGLNRRVLCSAMV